MHVFNLHEARFECTFGRGCDGVCCRNGRPPVYPDEFRRISDNLDRFVPLLRPEAAALVARDGFMSRRRKSGTTTLRVIGGWCVFFNAGCSLHRVGLMEGDAARYKPFACATFPLEKHPTHGWYVRQKGLLGEVWDLRCLDPGRGHPPAAESLTRELRMIEQD